MKNKIHHEIRTKMEKKKKMKKEQSNKQQQISLTKLDPHTYTHTFYFSSSLLYRLLFRFSFDALLKINRELNCYLIKSL